MGILFGTHSLVPLSRKGRIYILEEASRAASRQPPAASRQELVACRWSLSAISVQHSPFRPLCALSTPFS